MSTEDQDKDLKYKEESDGSVVVDVPETDDTDDGEELEAAAGGEARASDEDGDHDDADGDDDNQSDEDDVDPVRQARRARRRAKKEYIKRTSQEKDQRLQMLDRQNRELQERLAILERKAHSSDLAQIDRAIQEEHNALRYAQMKMREATDNADGDSLTSAQEAWYEARRKIDALQNLKDKAVQHTKQDGNIPDPRIIRYSNDWQDRNSWYDPDLRDEDSQIAKLVDTRLAKEGWDPSSKEYWDEFDRRLQKRLPHLYTDSREERQYKKPRSVVVGGGREAVTENGKVRIQIEPEKIRAIKEAGLWDNPETRKKILQRYAREARKYTRS